MTKEDKKAHNKAYYLAHKKPKKDISGENSPNWKGGRVKIICKTCGKEKEYKLNVIKKGHGKFCSKKCKGIRQSQEQAGEKSIHWKGGKVKINCKVCGKEKYYKQNDIKRGGGRFCSKKCLGLYWSGKNHPNWKGGKIQIICKGCGKKKHVDPDKLRKNRGKFCSRSCSAIWRIKYQKTHNTDIERLIEDELIRRNIPYTKQAPLLGITLVDFLLLHDVVIYCDGDYWHNKPDIKQRDDNQNFILKFYGYKVFRFTGKEIKKSARKCLNKILKPTRLRR